MMLASARLHRLHYCVPLQNLANGGIHVLASEQRRLYGSYGAIEDEAHRQFEVNLFGLGSLTQLVLPHMRAQKFGTIINISSMGGRLTTPLGGWYHATKYAVNEKPPPDDFR